MAIACVLGSTLHCPSNYRRRLVLAPFLTQYAADFAQGGVGADCVEDGGHQVGVGMGWGLGGLAQSCQRSLDGGVVPFGLELRQPRVLSPVGFRVGARPDVYSAGSPR